MVDALQQIFCVQKNLTGDKSTTTCIYVALTFSSNVCMKDSVGLMTLPKGRGNSMSPHLKTEYQRSDN